MIGFENAALEAKSSGRFDPRASICEGNERGSEGAIAKETKALLQVTRRRFCKGSRDVFAGDVETLFAGDVETLLQWTRGTFAGVVERFRNGRRATSGGDEKLKEYGAMAIRKARTSDLSRVAEIFVFNNRVNYLPIFQDERFSFGKLQVVSIIDTYFAKDEVLEHLYVFDDGLIRGFMQVNDDEICKLYVDPFFQGAGIGDKLIAYAVNVLHANHLWALEKNTRALAFYQRHAFQPTGEKKFEEGTTEYLVHLKR